jgi:glycosyltransferase involved in cell wall biosynthesis
MVSIIIPTVDRHQSLVKLVDSIERQQFDAADLEILIVYNFPAKKRPRKFFHPSHRGIKVIEAPAPGVNQARNAGILAARGDVFLFIDDDCLMDDPHYLQKLVDHHRSEPQRLSLGGPYKLAPKASFWDRAYFANMNLWLERQKISGRSSRALLGGNASYKAEVFAHNLRFTPGIKYGGSETPLNEKIFEDFGPHGFYEDLAITHQSHITLRNFIYKAYMQGCGFAEQTKNSPPDIQGPLDVSSIASRLLRWALYFYSFVFMVGYRTSIYERRFFLMSVLEEFWIHLRKPWLPLFTSFTYSAKILRMKNDAR